MKGKLSTLNVGEGDVVVTFEGADDKQVDDALTMLVDMQKRGYAILVKQADGKFARAHSIDRATKSYVVMQPQRFDKKREEVKFVAPLSDEAAAVNTQKAAAAPAGKPGKGNGRRGRAVPVRQGIGTSEAVAVSRSAGG